MDNNKTNEKLTIYDYEKKYSSGVNTKRIKFFTILFLSGIGVILFIMFALLSLRIYDYNQYAGYISMGLFLIVYVLIYVVPLVKIQSLKSFEVNVNSKNARAAKKHNQELRNELADKMIEFTNNVDGANWYPSEKIELLETARLSNDNEAIKSVLNDLYNKDINNKSKQIIFKYALKSGLTTAVSQSPQIDTIMVVTYNLQLIKDIVFLYGFRPSDAQMLKIYRNVLASSLAAYGLNSVDVGGSIVKGVAKGAIKSVPFLGDAIATIANSALQGVANLTLTSIIGFQTKKYLIKEYKLQNILDSIVLDSEDEVKNLITEAESELKKATKSKEKVEALA